MNNLHNLGSDFTTDALCVLGQLEDRANARHLNLSTCLPALLIWTLLRWEKDTSIVALESLGVDCRILETNIDLFLRNKSSSNNYLHPVKLICDWANREASLLGTNYKGTEHLWLGAILAADHNLLSLLHEQGMNYDRVKNAVIDLLQLNPN